MEYPNLKWHRMTADDVISELHTNAACGLNRKAARSRSRRNGKNTLFDINQADNQQIWKRLVADAALWIFLFVCVLLLCFSEVATGVIALICVAIGVFFLWRFMRREKLIEGQISSYRIPWVSVIRDGKRILISAREVVVGDILLLKAGDTVPCDCRILSLQNLTVYTLLPDDKGKAQWVELPKKADFVYGFGSQEVTPGFVNMLYGGSRIAQGEVAAVAVAIGKDTFIGAMQMFTVPSEQKGNEKENIYTIRPFLKIYGILLLLLMLPLTLIGILMLPQERTLMALFASLSAVLAIASPALLDVYFQVVSLRARKESFGRFSQENRAVIKSVRAVDRLSSITDVFVLGKCGCSDGKLHLHRCMIGKDEIRIRKNEAYFALQPICEAFLLLSSAISEELEKDFVLPKEDDSALCNELIDASSFDVEAMRVRIKQVTMLSDLKNDFASLEVRSKIGAYRLYFSEKNGFWNACYAYENNGVIFPMDLSVRKCMEEFYHSAQAEGCRIITCIRDVDGRKILYGALAIREEMQKTLISIIEELKQSQARTTFFFAQEDQITKHYLQALGLWEHAILRSESLKYSRSIEDCIEHHRVLVGFSRKEILNVLLSLRKQGKRIAVMGNTSTDFSVMQNAFLSVACDGMSYHSHAMQNGILEDDIQADGLAQSERCSQTMRRTADILVPRAQKIGGGLFAFSQVLADCRACRVRIRSILLPLLLLSQFACVLLTTLSVMFGGVGLMSVLQILTGGFLLPLALLFSILTLPIPQNQLRQWLTLDAVTIEKTLLKKAMWIPLLISTFGCVLYCFVLHLSGLLTLQSASSFVAVSYILLELIFFMEIIISMKMPIFHKGWIAVWIFVLSVTALVVLSQCFSVVATITGFGDWTILSVISLPLLPILFYVSRFFVRLFSHRTSK